MILNYWIIGLKPFPFKMIKPLSVILLVLVFVTSGCGTLTSLWNYDPYEHYEYLNPSQAQEVTSRVYSGLGWHFTAQTHCEGPYKISGPCQFPSGIGFKGIWLVLVEGFATFDYLFLSSILDTAILPVTILQTCCEGDLSHAAAQGDLELVQRLLEAGADVNGTDAWGHTPLLSACWAGHKEIVQVLLERGADPTATTPRGWTGIRFANRVGHPEIVDLLKAAGAEDETGAEE